MTLRYSMKRRSKASGLGGIHDQDIVRLDLAAAAEASQVPDHLPIAELLRSFGDRWASSFVTD